MQPSAQLSAQGMWQPGSSSGTKRYGYSVTPPPSMAPLAGNYPYPYYQQMPSSSTAPLIPTLSPVPQQLSPMPATLSPVPTALSPMPQQLSPMPGNYAQMPYDMRSYPTGSGYTGSTDGGKRFCPSGAGGPAEQEAASQDEGLRVLLNFRRSMSPMPNGCESG